MGLELNHNEQWNIDLDCYFLTNKTGNNTLVPSKPLKNIYQPSEIEHDGG